ncbi:MAG: DUF2752 domain-containing protein [Kiritimatiellia bacterium]
MLAPALLVAAWIYYPLCNYGPTLCLWKRFLGFSCPGCGLTRAACLLAHGHCADALAMNWRIIPVAIIITAVSFRAAKTLFHRMRQSASSLIEKQDEGEMVWHR